MSMKTRPPRSRPARFYRVREVSALTGVSVRTLHYYDERGLLPPRERSASGYRLYSDEDLFRLQEILIQRELGFSLEEIKRAFEARSYDRREALEKLRGELAARLEHNQKMLGAVDRALEALEQTKSGPVSASFLKELFSGFDPARHASEAGARWGATEVWRISEERTKQYGREDWWSIRTEQKMILSGLSDALREGQPPDSPTVRALVERHRQFIDRWFYPCSLKQHLALTRLYESDARFGENIDRHGTGLTAFLVAAIRAQEKRIPAPSRKR